jgi:hypothetical protein
MKKPKSNARAAKASTAQDQDLTQHELSGSLPPVSELARLVAILVQGKSLGETDYASLAREAIKLWGACEQERESWVQELAVREEAHAIDTPNTPDEYPKNRDQFLSELVPAYKNRADELARIGKAYVRHVLLELNRLEPTLDQIADAYGRWPTYEIPYEAKKAAQRFQQWYKGYISGVRRVASKSDGAVTRTKKANAKKKMKKKL